MTLVYTLKWFLQRLRQPLQQLLRSLDVVIIDIVTDNVTSMFVFGSNYSTDDTTFFFLSDRF